MKKLLFQGVQYQEHPVYKGYFVSKCGQVVSTYSKPKIDLSRQPYSGRRKLSLCKRKSNLDYLFCVIYRKGERVNKFVHTLVLETYIGTPLKGQVCRHLDNNAANNHVDNLSWGTQKENMQDKFQHGTQQTGENHGRSKLNWHKVKLIRNLKQIGWPYTKLMKLACKLFQVSKSCFDAVYYNRNWHE